MANKLTDMQSRIADNDHYVGIVRLFVFLVSHRHTIIEIINNEILLMVPRVTARVSNNLSLFWLITNGSLMKWCF